MPVKWGKFRPIFMNASQGRIWFSHWVSVAGLLAAIPVLAQSTPPLTPPLPPHRDVPPTPNFIARAKPAQSAASIVAAAPAPAFPAPVFATTSPVVSPAAGSPVVTSPIVTIPGTGAPAQATGDPNSIKWDAETKEYSSKIGDTNANFSFWLTNVSSAEVLINSVRTSCGCTVAKLPSQPWHIAPGGSGPIDVTVNLVGKYGNITKGVTVESSVGVKQLTVKVNIAGGAPGAPNPMVASMNDADRLKNIQQALADRQVVFKNQECAKCHADPAKGKVEGRLVYTAVCSGCHDSHLRAAMVPTTVAPADRASSVNSSSNELSCRPRG